MVVNVIIEAKRSDCKVQNALKQLGIDYVITRVNAGEEITTHLVRVSNGVNKELIESLRRNGLNVQVIDEKTLWIKAPSCSACRVISTGGVFVKSGMPMDFDRIRYSVLAPSIKRARSIVRSMRFNGIWAKIIDARQVEAGELTDRQLEVLMIAMRLGYFDGKISLTELARNLGIAPSTLSEILKKSIKKVISHYLNELSTE